MTALDNAVTKNEADITSLRSALTANTTVNTALDAQRMLMLQPWLPRMLAAMVCSPFISR